MDFKPQSSPADSSAMDPVVLDGSGKSDPVGCPQKVPFAQIDNDLRRAVAERKVVGIVAMAATAEGIVYDGQFGKRDLSSGQGITSESVFWLRSLTKAITASACMQLVEQGRIHLDQPMSDVLPELANPKVIEGFDVSGKPKLRPAKRPITLRHLLTHTSGYTYSTWSDTLIAYQDATGIPDVVTCKNASFATPLEFDPGERWQYGMSIDWVGKIIEAVADQSLEIYFRENIFAPLGMIDSGFLLGTEQKRRMAILNRREADGSLARAPFDMVQRPEFFMGGGGLFSTPRDYMAFLQMLLHRGTFRGARILKPETVTLMLQSHIGDLLVTEAKTARPAFSHSFDQFPGMVHKWGLSFDINTSVGPNGRSAGSISWGGLFNCYFWLDPTERVTGAIFTQMLPFFDPDVVKIYGAFERCIYDGLRRA